MTMSYAAPRAALSSPAADAALLVGRILLVVLFLFSGFGKLTDVAGTAGAIAGKGLPMPQVLAIVAGVAELAGGVLIAIGWYTRLVALGLIVLTLVATYFFHDFWHLPAGAEQMDMIIHAMKNLSIVGAFVMLIGSGPGSYSIDGRTAARL